MVAIVSPRCVHISLQPCACKNRRLPIETPAVQFDAQLLAFAEDPLFRVISQFHLNFELIGTLTRLSMTTTQGDLLRALSTDLTRYVSG